MHSDDDDDNDDWNDNYFVIFQGNKALYKLCATWRGEFEETVAVFLCNDGDGHRWVIVVVFFVALISAPQSGAHRRCAYKDF